MAVDTAAYIGSFDTTKPTASDPKAEGDDNFRHIKTAVKASFPNVTGAVTATHTELNYVDGVTSAIQTQLDALTGTFASYAPLASPAFTGTPTVPTATNGTSTMQTASTAFVQAAIASVNAQTATVVSVNTATAITATAGQHIVCTNASAVTVNLPASPSVGDTVWVTPGNGRVDNVLARNGNNIMGLAEDMTLDNANATVQVRYINASLGWRLV